MLWNRSREPEGSSQNLLGDKRPLALKSEPSRSNDVERARPLSNFVCEANPLSVAQQHLFWSLKQHS